MSNPENLIKSLGKSSALVFMPEVVMLYEEAAESFNKSLEGLSYDKNTIIPLLVKVDAISNVIFDAMVSYMLDYNRNKELRLEVQKEVRRLIKKDKSEIISIVEDKKYQNRYYYVFKM